MPNSERLEAKGPRGEACIIVRSWGSPGGSAADARGVPGAQPSYRLGTGERLNPTADPAVFETQDGSRRFTLRKLP